MPETWGFQPEKVRRSDHRTIFHRHMDWGNVRADMVRRTGLQRQETRIAVKNHTFLFNLQGDARSGEDYLDGRRIPFTPRHAGSVVFLPVDSEWRGWDEGDIDGSCLFVSLRSQFVHDAFEPRYLRTLLPSIGFRDNLVEASLHRIARELKSPNPMSIMMVESQAVQILVHMIRMGGLKLRPAKGGISPLHLKRVIELMNAHLAQAPSTEMLAAEIGMSQRHFFRAFKQSTGKSPSVYMADLRLKRALDMVRFTNCTATEIALRCGFASPSHLAFAFKRIFGERPLQHRRSWTQK